ncbi:DGQHR domain-containing protein [Pseudanabaena sp. PCC 6802]|uniref:DGQHR domain-containing protein n=1 Tax=Pseudanabaena sp. PCC 6802 TaxID=118173 RepID=UPI000365EA2B|nr:DNA sulfur modification protein DndB [Pseudanabaena sp. PCC 6802]
MKQYYLPALRGLFGNWVYYTCLIPMSEVVNRAWFADEIYKSQKLSDMIQRELSEDQVKMITTYLQSEEQRFFNSLVVALCGGKPSWHGFENFHPLQDDINIEDIPSYAKGSVGFLSFTGEEKMFAVDGEHRLAGMREAVKSKPELGDDEVPLILVAHRETEDGRRRTRNLVQTLRKTIRS